MERFSILILAFKHFRILASNHARQHKKLRLAIKELNFLVSEGDQVDIEYFKEDTPFVRSYFQFNKRIKTLTIFAFG